MKPGFHALIFIGTSAVTWGQDAPPEPVKMSEWRKRIPQEITARIPGDSAELLRTLGYDPRPENQSGKKPVIVKMWGHDTANFDEDETNDWVIHVRTRDFLDRPVAGSLIYDRTDEGWICVARLQGTFPTTWGIPVEGRLCIRTLEAVAEEFPRAQRERYFRWHGTKYLEERVEYSRGG